MWSQNPGGKLSAYARWRDGLAFAASRDRGTASSSGRPEGTLLQLLENNRKKMAKSSFRTHTLRQFAVGCANTLLPYRSEKHPQVPHGWWWWGVLMLLSVSTLHFSAVSSCVLKGFARISQGKVCKLLEVTQSSSSSQLLGHRGEPPPTPGGNIQNGLCLGGCRTSLITHLLSTLLIRAPLARENAKGVPSGQRGSPARCPSAWSLGGRLLSGRYGSSPAKPIAAGDLQLLLATAAALGSQCGGLRLEGLRSPPQVNIQGCALGL